MLYSWRRPWTYPTKSVLPTFQKPVWDFPNNLQATLSSNVLLPCPSAQWKYMIFLLPGRGFVQIFEDLIDILFIINVINVDFPVLYGLINGLIIPFPIIIALRRQIYIQMHKNSVRFHKRHLHLWIIQLRWISMYHTTRTITESLLCLIITDEVARGRFK